MFKQILVPLDGSVCAEQALPMAARIARTAGATITLLQVLQEDLPEYAPYIFTTGVMSQESRERDQQAVLAYLSDVASRPLLSGIPVKTETLFGFPADTIAQLAHMDRMDLIVMCSHGRTGFQRFIFGSVAQHVARQSSIPVLVLHEHTDGPEVEENRLHHFPILVALDGSARAEAIIRPAAMLTSLLSSPEPGDLHLVRVVPPVLSLDPYEAKTVEQINREEYNLAERYLEAITRKIFLSMVPDLRVQITFSVVVAEDVPDTLVAATTQSESENAAPIKAIALATHGFQGLSHLLYRSVTSDVLVHTRLPLLILKQVDDNHLSAATANGTRTDQPQAPN